MQAYPVLGDMPTMGFRNPTQQVTVASSGPTLRRVQLPSSWADQCRRRRVDAGPRGRSVEGLAWLRARVPGDGGGGADGSGWPSRPIPAGKRQSSV